MRSCAIVRGINTSAMMIIMTRPRMQQGGNRKNSNASYKIENSSGAIVARTHARNNAYAHRVRGLYECVWACDVDATRIATFMSGSCPCAWKGD